MKIPGRIPWTFCQECHLRTPANRKYCYNCGVKIILPISEDPDAQLAILRLIHPEIHDEFDE